MGEVRKDNRKRASPRTFGGEERSFSGSFHSAPKQYSETREMHKATCSECNSSCDVPFKPTTGKPVYCRECYKKRRDRF